MGERKVEPSKTVVETKQKVIKEQPKEGATKEVKETVLGIKPDTEGSVADAAIKSKDDVVAEEEKKVIRVERGEIDIDKWKQQ